MASPDFFNMVAGRESPQQAMANGLQPGAAGKKSGAPPPEFNGDYGPDSWQKAAEAQSGQSHVGMNGPVGSSGWSQDPKTGQWTQTQGFNGPLGGAAENYQQQIANQAPLDFGSLPQIDSGQGQMQTAENAAYGQAKSRLDPMFAQQGEALQSQLAAKGLDPGTEAANNAQGNFDRAKNDAYSSAQNYAVGQGLQAQQQAYGQSMGARQQALGEMLKQRGMPLEQLQGIMGLLGGAQGVGQAGAPNYLGAMQGQSGFNLENANMQNQAQGQGWQNLIGAGGSIAGIAGMLSDERAKQKIDRLPIEVVKGVPLAIFEFRHAPNRKCVGVIAQDVLKVHPRLVRKRADGLLCVDYEALGRAA